MLRQMVSQLGRAMDDVCAIYIGCLKTCKKTRVCVFVVLLCLLVFGRPPVTYCCICCYVAFQPFMVMVRDTSFAMKHWEASCRFNLHTMKELKELKLL